MWWGQLSVDNGLWRVILCMLAFPLLTTGLITFRCHPAAGLGAAGLGAGGCRATGLGAAGLGAGGCRATGLWSYRMRGCRAASDPKCPHQGQVACILRAVTGS